MIGGNLTDDLEGYVSLTVRGSGGETAIEAIIDTGFNGFLSLSAEQISDLDLEWSHYETAELADGEEHLTSVFNVEADWDGQWRPIEVVALGSTPLLGMQLLKEYRLLIDVVEGGIFTISPLNKTR